MKELGRECRLSTLGPIEMPISALRPFHEYNLPRLDKRLTESVSYSIPFPSASFFACAFSRHHRLLCLSLASFVAVASLPLSPHSLWPLSPPPSPPPPSDSIAFTARHTRTQMQHTDTVLTVNLCFHSISFALFSLSRRLRLRLVSLSVLPLLPPSLLSSSRKRRPSIITFSSFTRIETWLFSRYSKVSLNQRPSLCFKRTFGQKARDQRKSLVRRLRLQFCSPTLFPHSAHPSCLSCIRPRAPSNAQSRLPAPQPLLLLPWLLLFQFLSLALAARLLVIY